MSKETRCSGEKHVVLKLVCAKRNIKPQVCVRARVWAHFEGKALACPDQQQPFFFEAKPSWEKKVRVFLRRKQAGEQVYTHKKCPNELKQDKHIDNKDLGGVDSAHVPRLADWIGQGSDVGVQECAVVRVHQWP